MSKSHSTPLRHSGRNVHQITTNPTPPTSQEVLQAVLKDELGAQTWEFPSDILARMLSAKRRNNPLEPNEIDDLSAYTCDIDGVSHVLDTACAAFDAGFDREGWKNLPGGEREHYPTIREYLNKCVTVCHAALDSIHFKVEKRKRWYSELKFVVYDKATGDGVDNAAALKPDLAGGELAGFTHGVLYWNNPKSSLQILLPVEVKNNDSWTAIVSQAATYARCLFSASPSRQFALVIGINHASKQLRFLVFHRGGLTASKALPMLEDGSRREILRLFLAILTWESAEDAGFAEWLSDAEIVLPRDKDDEQGIVGVMGQVLSHGICVRGRATMVSRVSYDATSHPAVALPPAKATPLVPITPVRQSPRLQERSQATGGSGKNPQKAPSSKKSAGKAAIQPAPNKKPTSSSKGLGKTALASSSKQKSAGGKSRGTSQHALRGEKTDRDETPQSPIAIFTERRRNVKFIRTHQEMLFREPLKSPPVGQRADAVVKISWPIDDTRSVEADACFATRQPISNRLFLPSGSADLRDFHWSLFATPDSPPCPEYRSLWVHVSSLVGKSLSRVDHPKDLFYSIAHAMLGWLSILQHGFLHRDISIGNVLTIDNAITMPKFTVEATSDLADVLKAMSLEESSDVNQESSDVEQESSDVEQESSVVKQEITRLLDDLNITEQCRGFTIDLDMATSLKTLFSKVHDGERSGTRQFMSDPLVDSLKFSELYLQSPVDDLCSFYYVGQWAALFNQGAEDQNRMSPRFLDLRNSVDGSAPQRNEATTKIGKISTGSLRQYPPFLDWIEATDPGQDLVGGEAHRFYMPLFFKFAYRGVKEYLEILKEDAEELAKAL
ncbi:hypothetical protein ONZ45_g19220 [Pleurotus djamor]|nr:hypothetical protein ONZ45_g19220 [Pleurotus djamor]